MATDIVHLTKSQTVLDYGSGKCSLGLSNLRRYDPAISGIDQPPEPADLVISRCVLEHVEPQCLDPVLYDMQRCALKAALIVVSCFASNEKLPDGRTAHLVVKPMSWWLPKLMQRWEINTAMLLPRQRFWFFGKARG